MQNTFNLVLYFFQFARLAHELHRTVAHGSDGCIYAVVGTYHNHTGWYLVVSDPFQYFKPGNIRKIYVEQDKGNLLRLEYFNGLAACPAFQYFASPAVQ